MTDRNALPSDDIIRYHGLMRVWHDATAMQSISYFAKKHEAYQEVLDLKDRIPLVELLIRDLPLYCHNCFLILWEIVPDPPKVPEEMRGRISELIKLWQKWRRNKMEAVV